MNNSKLYKELFVDANIKDFLWQRNLELNAEVQRIMIELKNCTSEDWVRTAMEKTLEMVIKTRGKSLREKKR